MYDYKAGIKSVREKCNPEVMIIDIPGYCEPCELVYQLMIHHAKLMMEAVDLIESANTTTNQVFLTEGLEKFWQVKEMRHEINSDVDMFRREYGLNI